MTFSLSHQLVRAARIPSSTRQIHDPACEHTWHSLSERVARLAGALRSLGLERGDRVAILAMNSAEYLGLYFAIPWAGGICVPINIRLNPQEVVFWLNDSQSRILIVDDAFAEIAAMIRDQLRTVEHIVHLGDSAAPSRMHAMRELLDDSTPMDDAGRCDDDVALLLYTGGTTGTSKGVMLTHECFIFAALQWSHAVTVNASDTLLVAIPMFHLAAALNCIAAMMLAAELVILPRFDAKDTLKAIETQRVTKAAFVPAILELLIRSPSFDTTDVSSLKRITYGGAPMPAPILEYAQEKLPQVNFYQIYGQTECGGVATCLTPEYHVLEGSKSRKRNTAGKPVTGTDIRILAPDGTELPAGTAGEICLRGPSTSPGYWNLPALTESLYTDGWLHTGDVGFLDEDGFLTIIDRIKDMIISGGENVFAAEVENVLYQHSAVAQCAVIGIPSRKWGEQVHAVVRLIEGASVSERELMDFCRSRIAAYKSIRSVEFRDEPFPLSSMNKILKRELRKPHWP